MVTLKGDAVSSLMDLRVLVFIPLHMRAEELQVVPMMQVIPQYRMSGKANSWNNLISKNVFTVGEINSDFNSIQACLNSVPAGSLITVYPGLYNERVMVTKPVTIVGAGGLSNTFLTATITISASHVTLDGLTFKGNSNNGSMVKIEASHVVIRNCKFTGQYTVDQSTDLFKVELAISCHDCRHVKILNNIFFHCMYALSLDKAEHFTIRSNVFSYGYASMVLQGSTNVLALGNLFEFNRAIVWLKNSTMLSFSDNVYDYNLQSDVCLQYENQTMLSQKLINVFPKFGEHEDMECHYLEKKLPTVITATVDAMALPGHIVLEGWCKNQVNENQTVDIPEIEEQLFAQSGCVSLLGSVVATVYPQGTYTIC